MEDLLQVIIQTASPDSYIESLIVSDLKRLSKYDPFDSKHEVQILLSYYKDALQYSKSSLYLSGPKQLQFLLLSNKLICEGTIKKPRSSISSLKSLISDFSSIFNPSDLQSIQNFFSSSYFQNLRLYNYIFSSKENAETTHVKAWIDEPLPTMPLQQSVQRVKNRMPIEESPEPRISMQRSRSKIAGYSRRGNDSKEPPQDLVLDSQQSEHLIIDPVEETMQRLHIEMESELQKREAAIEVEIEEIKKRYK